MLRTNHHHNHHHLPQKTLQIKQLDDDHKFLTRALSKESNNNKKKKGESSFRVLYYGDAPGSVPFMWESQPGTPKHTLSETSLPPLTPPPSYQFNEKLHSSSSFTQLKHSSKSNFLRSIFTSKKTHVAPSLSPSSISSSSSYTSYSMPSTPLNYWSFIRGKKKTSYDFSRPRSAVQFGFEEEVGACSPSSTLCFGGGDGVSRKVHGGHGMKKVKNAFLSFFVHGKT